MTASHGQGGRPEGGAREIDVSERGAPKDGNPQLMNRRMFMQLQAFRTSDRAHPDDMIGALQRAFSDRNVGSVIYEDASDPRGLAVLTFSEDPKIFVEEARAALNSVQPEPLQLRSEFTMLGRSYSSGYEDDLEYWLLRRPMETVLNPEWPWAVWYPLRRTGAFAQLEPKEQAGILREHAMIGRQYGTQDLAHDVRLACHGLDKNDNEFVIGLIGKELHPLSHVVQAMRKTKQTSQYIAMMGPFFVGRARARTKPRSA